MREILFRGKRFDNGKWEYGNLIISPLYKNCVMIERRPEYTSERGYSTPMVDPETVGQYTGLTDCGNEKLFEHDIVTAKFKANGARYNFKIVFKNGYFLFDNGYVAVLFNEIRSVRKIGNIHDNPELLKSE